MLKQLGSWAMLSSQSLSKLSILSKLHSSSHCNAESTISTSSITKKLRAQPAVSRTCCTARRRAIYEDDNDDEEEEYGHNKELATLELYSQSARGEALLVHGVLDEQEVEVLIFKL